KGLSFADVLAQTHQGGRFAGYRYATAVEAQDIFMKVGIPIADATEYRFPEAQQVLDAIGRFGQLFGLTVTDINGVAYAFNGVVGDDIARAPGYHPWFEAAPCCSGAFVHTSLAWQQFPWTVAGFQNEMLVSLVDEITVAFSEDYKQESMASFL